MPRREIDWFGDLEKRWQAFSEVLLEDLNHMCPGDALGIFPPEIGFDEWEWWIAIHRSDGGLVVEIEPSDLSTDQKLALLDASWALRPNDDTLYTAAWDPSAGKRGKKMSAEDLNDACRLIVKTLREILAVAKPKHLELKHGSHEPID